MAYDSASARVQLAEELARRLAALPNVETAAAASHRPIADCRSRFGLQVEGEPRDRSREQMVTGNVVTRSSSACCGSGWYAAAC